MAQTAARCTKTSCECRYFGCEMLMRGICQHIHGILLTASLLYKRKQTYPCMNRLKDRATVPSQKPPPWRRKSCEMYVKRGVAWRGTKPVTCPPLTFKVMALPKHSQTQNTYNEWGRAPTPRIKNDIQIRSLTISVGTYAAVFWCQLSAPGRSCRIRYESIFIF